jgi:HK97 family phage major capsid protein
MSTQMDKAASVLRDIALKAVDGKTGEIRAEYTDALAKANADIDRKLDDIRLEVAKRNAEKAIESKQSEARKAFKSVLPDFLKSGHVRPEIAQKADGYVRFDAATAGNLLLQPEMAADINRQVLEFSPVLQVVDVQDVSGPSLIVPVQSSYLSAYWADEDEPSTLGKDAFNAIEVTPNELRARVWFSQSMLDDAAYDIEGYTMQSITERFAQKIGNAVIAGNGVKKPQSLRDNVSSYKSGSLTLTFNQLINLTGQVKPGYLSMNTESVGWMTSPVNRSLIRALALTNANNYAWEVDGKLANPERLLGYPVFVGATGDFASGSAAGLFTSLDKPILFGNFKKAYTIGRKPEIKIIRDIYSGSSQFRVFINVMQRIDGRVTQAEAVYALRMET